MESSFIIFSLPVLPDLLFLSFLVLPHISSCCFCFSAKYGSPHIEFEECRIKLHSRSNSVISRLLLSTVVFGWSEDLWIHNHFNCPKQSNKQKTKFLQWNRDWRLGNYSEALIQQENENCTRVLKRHWV